MRGDDRTRVGAALLEVLAALVLIAVAGTGLLTLVGQTAHTMRTVRNAERDARSASETLSRLVLLDRSALLARRGESPFGRWELRVTEVSPVLFDVAILPVGLSTTLYRPDTNDASP